MKRSDHVKKRKRVKCSRCGQKYSVGVLRCPDCLEPNPLAGGPGLPRSDRLIGVFLIVLGVLIAIPAFWVLLLVPGFGARGRFGLALVAVIPVGTVFHGVLLVCGIHPKDFYGWWENLSELSRAILCALLALVVIGLVAYFFFIKE